MARSTTSNPTQNRNEIEKPRRGWHRDRGKDVPAPCKRSKDDEQVTQTSRQNGYGLSQTNLFDWLAERELRATDPATRWIAHRFGINSPSR